MPARLIVSLVLVFGWAATARTVEAQELRTCTVIATTIATVTTDNFGGYTNIEAEVNVERNCFGGNADSPASALGGGTGGEIACETRPFGPLAEVEAVWAAVNADQAPVVADPTYEEDVLI
ncbi:MAG: hypothetical protein ABW219_13135, partial [Ilumatobacteraceae bacterium]